MKYLNRFLLFWILAYINTNGAHCLHCYKCMTEDFADCGNVLHNDLFLQKCSDGFDFCTLVWTKENAVERGCSNGTVCEEYKGDAINHCCTCTKDGCNWGKESCNGQIMRKANAIIAVVIIVLKIV
ncbi:uncharacterized protein LOC142227625 [Haematobia irritans]|uniref:uncharacterized protein LOC142227625 n=1 Tax=Haematobia irritans TaxID=7368 RepID=UPI003F50140B